MRSFVRALDITLVLAIFTGCASSPHSKGSRPERASNERSEVPIPADLKAEIDWARFIGTQLYRLDKVAAAATDITLEVLTGDQEGNIGGYVPQQLRDADGKLTDSFLVSFFTREAPPRLANEVRFTPGKKPAFEIFTPPAPIPDDLMALVRARQLAIKAHPRLEQPLNPIVLPRAVTGEPGILVYLLAGTTKPNVAVLGRHFRALVSDDGERILSIEPLSKTILELSTRRQREEGTLAGLFVNHVVSDAPLETHVFASLLAGLPIFLGTRRGVWRVNGDTIAFLGTRRSALQ